MLQRLWDVREGEDELDGLVNHVNSGVLGITSRAVSGRLPGRLPGRVPAGSGALIDTFGVDELFANPNLPPLQVAS